MSFKNIQEQIVGQIDGELSLEVATIFTSAAEQFPLAYHRFEINGDAVSWQNSSPALLTTKSNMALQQFHQLSLQHALQMQTALSDLIIALED